MHEASLMVNLMRQINALAKAEQARRIVGVSVWIGALSHMSAEHFAEHFNHAVNGTIAEGARIDVKVSNDPHDANAQDIVIKSIEVET